MSPRPDAPRFPRFPLGPAPRRWARVAALGSWLFALGGCRDWDPRRPFDRYAPEVDRALAAQRDRQFDDAERLLREYLGAGRCTGFDDERGHGGRIAFGERTREKNDAGFDLGLALFGLAERSGPAFGSEEDKPAEGPPSEEATRRDELVDCAAALALAIGLDTRVPIAVRARAYALAGNLEFLRREYETAVKDYDSSLALLPGSDAEGADPVGRDTAWNRAIALKRLEEQRKKEEEQKKKEEEQKKQDQEQQQQQDPQQGQGQQGQQDPQQGQGQQGQQDPQQGQGQQGQQDPQQGQGQQGQQDPQQGQGQQGPQNPQQGQGQQGPQNPQQGQGQQGQGQQQAPSGGAQEDAKGDPSGRRLDRAERKLKHFGTEAGKNRRGTPGGEWGGNGRRRDPELDK